MDPFGVFSITSTCLLPTIYIMINPNILTFSDSVWLESMSLSSNTSSACKTSWRFKSKIPKKLLHFHFFTDRSEHDSLVSRDAGPLPRTLRTLPPSQAWSHHFAHLHQPHQVNIEKVVRKQDKLKTLNSEHKHQWNIKFGVQTSISWVNKQNTNLLEIWFCLDATLASLAIQFNFLKQKQKI